MYFQMFGGPPQTSEADKLIASAQRMRSVLLQCGSDVKTGHVQRLHHDLVSILYVLHYKYEIEVVDIAYAVNMQWMAVYDFIDTRHEEMKKQFEEQKKAQKAQEVPHQAGVRWLMAPYTDSHYSFETGYDGKISVPKSSMTVLRAANLDDETKKTLDDYLKDMESDNDDPDEDTD